MKKVFSTIYIRQLPSFKKFGNPFVVAVCKRTESPFVELRRQIEAWFKKVQLSERNDLIKRLRSIDNSQSLSAFYELLIHEYCVEEGWTTEKHPSIAGMRPDFHISTVENDMLYVEVVSLMKDDTKTHNETRLYALLKHLDRIPSRYSLTIFFREWPADNCDPRKTCAHIKHWLDSLKKNPTYNELPFQIHGYDGTIFSKYCGAARPNRVSSWSTPLEDKNVVTRRIQRRLTEKIKK